MTWYLDPATGDVYEDDPEYTGQITTLSPDPDGNHALGRDLPPVMRDTWGDEANLGNSPAMNMRAGYILMDMATQNWQFGTPP